MASVVDKAKEEIIKGALDTMAKLGRGGLHALSPEDFEYYLCSFELLDSSGNTQAFMSFPVMPDSIVESTSHPTTVSKTTSGNTVLFNSSFAVKDISISGTFGRKLRVLTGQQPLENGGKLPFFSDTVNLGVLGDSTIIKSGYGLVKMLERILAQSHLLDTNGKPHLLIFSNYSFGSRYLVEVLNDAYQQSIETTAVWYYSLEMKAVADAQLSALARQSKKDRSFLGQVANQALSQTLTNILSSVADLTLGVNIT